MSKIAFFGHNVNDAAVRRRAVAFQRAGHKVQGFMAHRGLAKPTKLPFVNLGETQDNAYAQRLLSIFQGARIASKHAETLQSCDVIYARNLDMLAVAVRTSRILGLQVPIIYECLDVHHRLVGPSMAAKALRSLERRLLRHCSLVVISSPRFETEHFAVHHPGAYRSFLVENRMIEGDSFPDRPETEPTTPLLDGPLRIGWFGNLRCRKSLDLLLDLARDHPDDVEIVLRGYPAPGVFPDFEAELAPVGNVIYGGVYQAPMDLAEIYEAVDVVWACDWYEAGANSVWLLPNRIYEGGYFATPAIAPAGTQTAQWLSDHGVGMMLEQPEPEALETLVSGLLIDRQPIADIRSQLSALPRDVFVEGPQTCNEIIAAALTLKH